MSAQHLPQPAPPTGNRLALVTTDDNSAPVIIVTGLSLTSSLLVLGVRLIIVKWKRHGIDDIVLSVGHVVAVLQWASIFFARDNGLGKALSLLGVDEQDRMARAVSVSRILLVIVLCLSKISTVLVTRSLFQWERKSKGLLLDGVLVLVAVCGIVGLLTLSLECSSGYVLGGDEPQCTNHVARLRSVMMLDMATELIVFALPPMFLLGFEIASRNSFLIILAFSFRLPYRIIAFAVMYLLTYTKFIGSHNTGTAIVPTIVWQEVLVGYSLMSATIPSLRGFVQGFTTGGMGYVMETNREREYYGTSDSSYQLSWLSKGLRKASVQPSPSNIALQTLPSVPTTREGASVMSHGSQPEFISSAV